MPQQHICHRQRYWFKLQHSRRHIVMPKNYSYTDNCFLDWIHVCQSENFHWNLFFYSSWNRFFFLCATPDHDSLQRQVSAKRHKVNLFIFAANKTRKTAPWARYLPQRDRHCCRSLLTQIAMLNSLQIAFKSVNLVKNTINNAILFLSRLVQFWCNFFVCCASRATFQT